jgi:hypothetical protein
VRARARARLRLRLRLRLGMTWRVPLRMPAAYEMRFAAQPSRSARMQGMPPPTAASHLVRVRVRVR